MYPKSALSSLALLLAAQQCTASSSAHKRHGSHMAMHGKVAKRGGTKCKLPSDVGLYEVPGGLNGGFALSPDQECTPGSYCPIACPSGQVMAQWDPDSSYVYPQSMNGGLLCGDDGVASKPFPKKPYCVDGTDTVYIVNKCGSPASFCQTVLPGNEAMLIPTIASAGGKAKLAVPDASYWAGTAAHYYINPPGVGSEGCIWGDNTKAIGNWAPYVAGANTVSNGDTYLKIGWNPIFQFEGAGLEKTLPSFGLDIKCPNGGCNGLPCSIDPNDGLGAVNSGQAASGAGGSSFCVVTVSKGSTANIVLTSGGGTSGSYSVLNVSDEDSSKDKETTSTSTTKPSTTTSTTSKPTSTSTTTSTTPTTTSTSITTTTTTTASTTTSITTTTTSSTTTTPSTSTVEQTTTSSTPTSRARKTTASAYLTRPSVSAGVFLENITDTSSVVWTSAQVTPSVMPSTTDAESTANADDSSNDGGSRQAASAPLMSLIVALIAANYLY
ncbi:hypothetical protein Cpir12675_004157 [Ceratocystis pirilliformis]|uniref:Secreted beta-glucosidase adg3 n=1 Tax=Ceratocystis pirilliformis TaxID=259994 RepID=A0ABR3YZ78_9PEZI